jgi:Kef-type K+ transport system membrane component KefB
VRLDLRGLIEEPTALLRVPVLLVALLVVRGLPALLYRRSLGRRSAVAAGLLQATSLPFLVTAAQIGMELGQLSTVTGAALVCAGLLSVLLFPPTALSLLRERTPAERPPTPRDREATPAQHGQS